MKRFAFSALLVLTVAPNAWSQLPLIDDDFNENPCCTREEYDGGTCDKDWICQGTTVWIPPDADECDLDLDDDGTVDADIFNPFASFDPTNPCTQYPNEGYVLVTPAKQGQNGNMVRKERILYDNFKLTAEVELRDGSIGRPADGMTIVIVGTEEPPALGGAGGAMGAVNLGAVPTMVFEFDNWSCNGGDNNDQNHVQFAYAPGGFNNTDALPITPAPTFYGVFRKVDEALYPLNNRQPPPSENNRFLFEVIVQNGTVACFLTNDDAGLPRTQYYTYKIPNFQKFEGFLGVTGSTGDAWQNQILHSVKIEAFEGCLNPPAVVTRDLQPARAADEASGDYAAGDNVTVALSVSDIRTADANCNAAVGVVINDVVPAGWVVSNISDGGAFDAGSSTVSWTLTGASFTNGKSVSYVAKAPTSDDPAAIWSGSIRENLPLSESSGISGDNRLIQVGDFDVTCGGIRAWNILGGFSQAGGAGPGEDNMRLDYLTDGTTTEFDFVWFPGAQISPAFNGDGISGSFATGLQSGVLGRNPGGVPTVIAWNDLDSRIMVNDEVYGGDPNNVMCYAQAYVINETGGPLDVFIASASDDSIQILLNGQEAWIHNIPRGGSDACAPQDVSPDGILFTDPHVLEPGENSLIVKVFEGGGGWDFAVRFQDEAGQPITQGLKISKYPTSGCVKAPLKATRTLDTGKTVRVQGQDLPGWEVGDSYNVRIALSDIRGNSTGCAPPTAVTIKETVPAGWTPSAPSNGGTVAGQVITWNVSGAALAAGTVLSYSVSAGGSLGTVKFIGTMTDPGSIAPFVVGGADTLYAQTQYSQQGFIQQWLLLGPYQQPGLAGLDAPGEDKMRQDHIKDNKGITESTVLPKDGDTVATDYGPGAGKARSTRLVAATTGINPGGVPTWTAWQDSDDLIAFENYYGGDIDRIVMEAGVYVDVANDIAVDIGLASDDSVQVLLDGEEIWINNIARGSGNANEVQDTICGTLGGANCTNTIDVPQLAPLSKGVHFLLVKVFEGGGGHNFRLRFQDPATGEPITEGISVCTNPAGCAAGPVGKTFHRGDADNNGQLQLTDAVRILGFLFLGQAAPTCLDAGDADDNGQVQLTDAVRILGFLFLGQAPPAPPGPPGEACGTDVNAEEPDLGCETYTNC